MRSLDRLTEHWNELQKFWSDDVAKRFASDFLTNLMENGRSIDTINEELGDLLNSRPR